MIAGIRAARDIRGVSTECLTKIYEARSEAPVMRGWELVVGVALVLATFALAAPAAADVHCEAPWGVTHSAPVQDDALRGFDAGDAPEDAILLPGHGDYPGFVDPVRRDGGDLEDWYAFELPPSGADTRYRFSVARDYTTPFYVGAFQMEVFEPGVEVPLVTDVDSPAISRTDAAGGTWLVRVTAIPAADVYSCGQSAPIAPGLGMPGATSAVARNHWIYFGCEPFCADAGGAGA